MWMSRGAAQHAQTGRYRLLTMAQRVGQGDLDVRVQEEEGDDEIATLGRLFNQMTRQLKGQREALVDSHRGAGGFGSTGKH